MPEPIKIQILVVSDRIVSGEKPDECSSKLCEVLGKTADVTSIKCLPDDRQTIVNALMEIVDEKQTDIILTAGGVGLALHDVTPEATRDVADRIVPGITDAMRAAEFGSNPRALVNRGIAATRGNTLIINLPGGYANAVNGLKIFMPEMQHAVQALRGEE